MMGEALKAELQEARRVAEFDSPDRVRLLKADYLSSLEKSYS